MFCLFPARGYLNKDTLLLGWRGRRWPVGCAHGTLVELQASMKMALVVLGRKVGAASIYGPTITIPG